MVKLVLDRVELRDFKSFRGEHVIGPFTHFSGIIGPNGSGKSNVLDSIVFALFLDPFPRSTNYVYTTPFSTGESNCLVRVIMRKGKKEISFEREYGNDNFYRMNGKEMEEEEYIAEIRKLGIGPLSFLKQNEVDLIARKSPTELTLLLEEMSGSIELAEKYDELRIASEAAHEEVSMLDKRRRAAQTEKRHISDRQKEASHFKELAQKEEETMIEYALFQLFHLDKKVNSAKEDIQAIEERRIAVNYRIDTLQDERKEKQKESNLINDKITSIDNSLQVNEQSLRNVRASLTRERERNAFL